MVGLQGPGPVPFRTTSASAIRSGSAARRQESEDDKLWELCDLGYCELHELSLFVGKLV